MAVPELRIGHMPAPPVDDDTIDVWSIMLDLWRARWIVALGTLSATIVALVVSLLLPKSYEATATVFVAPSTFSTSLKSPMLSVEAYARLAESDYIRNVVRESLGKDANPSVPGLSLTRTVLYPSRVPQQPYLPLIGLVGQSSTAAGAQNAANAWARTLVEEQRGLTATTTASTVQFVVDEFARASQALTDVEHELKAVRDRHTSELSAARVSSGVDPRSDDRSPTVVIDTAPQAGTPAGDDSITLSNRDDGRGPKYAAARFQRELVLSIEGRLARARQDLEVARARAQVSTKASPADAEAARAQVDSLQATVTALQRTLDEERNKSAKMRADLVASEARIEQLQRSQSAQESVVHRKLDEVRARLKPLQDRIGDAQIARSQTEPELKLGALATLPTIPIGPDVQGNVKIATAMGFLVSLVGAWAYKRARS